MKEDHGVDAPTASYKWGVATPAWCQGGDTSDGWVIVRWYKTRKRASYMGSKWRNYAICRLERLGGGA